MPAAPASFRPRRRLFPILALVATTVLALTLWGATVWQLGSSAAALVTATPATGTVLACPQAPVGPGCSVRYTDAAGAVTIRAIDRPGLVGTAEGEVVPLAVAADGTVGLGGWRPWVDALVLLVLAVSTTAGATRWLRTVLADSDRHALVHGVDLTLLGDETTTTRSGRHLRDAR